MISAEALPLIFLGLMGLAILIYTILDGYDLGVGLLLPMHDEQQRDAMIASIGPFWDANETWLVLAIGILLIAFPAAHSQVLYELYIPAALMLCGLILRGVAFDFRAKAITAYRKTWDRLFKLGSLLAAFTQGYMLGMYVVAFERSWLGYTFACLSGLGVTAAYTYIGGAWLVMKTEGVLQQRAAIWSRYAGWLAAAGILAVSLVNPWVSAHVAERWFSFPEILYLAPIPLLSLLLILSVDRYLRTVPCPDDAGSWRPFVSVAAVFVLCGIGFGYSFYPYVVPGTLLASEAASAEASLRFILIGVVIVLPLILAYTAFSYRVFWGKSSDLRYY